MKITLHNFKCHRDAIYEIPDKGLILLSGPNGCGKSTIMRSIVYAIYGKIKDKIKKPYSHGTNTSKVVLEYLKMIITRTSRPNRVLLTYKKKEYEDDEAQEMINDIIGMNYEQFMIGIYIIQKSDSSILSLTPTEQVKFIETLAFSNNTHELFYTNVKNKIKEYNDQRIKLESQITLLSNQLEEKQNDCPDEPKLPKNMNNKDIKKEINNLEAKLKLSKQELDSYESQLNDKRVIHRKNKDVNDKIIKLTSEIENYKKMKDELSFKPETEKIENIISKKNEAENVIIEIKNFLDVNEKKIQLDFLIEEHNKSLLSQLQKIKLISEEDVIALEEKCEKEKQDLLKFNEEKANFDINKKQRDEAQKILEFVINGLKEKFPDEVKGEKFKFSSKISIIFNSIKLFITKKTLDLSNTIDILQKKITPKLKCPHCSEAIIFFNNTLCKCENEDDNEEGNRLSDFEGNRLKTLQETFKSLSEYAKKFNDKLDILDKPLLKLRNRPTENSEKRLFQMKNQREKYNDLKDQLDNKKLPDSLLKLSNKINNLQMKNDQTFSKDDLLEKEQYLVSINKEIDNYKNAEKSYKHYTQEINKKTALRNELKIEANDTDNIEELEAKISNFIRQIMDTTNLLSKKQIFLKAFSDYERYKVLIKDIENIKGKMLVLNIELKNNSNFINGCSGLLSTGKEAEIIAIEETIRLINQYAQTHLEKLFENDITIRLNNLKNKKNNIKLQMNTVIEYKGEIYEDISELSAGERQRAELAFLLAVNDIINGKFLLLDECFAFVDARIHSDVLNYLKELNKLVIVSSHEAINGIFDHEINL